MPVVVCAQVVCASEPVDMPGCGSYLSRYQDWEDVT